MWNKELSIGCNLVTWFFRVFVFFTWVVGVVTTSFLLYKFYMYWCTLSFSSVEDCLVVGWMSIIGVVLFLFGVFWPTLVWDDLIVQ